MQNIMEITIENAEKILRKYLENNQKKLEHSLRVAETSKMLANIYGAPVEDVTIVALLHDIGKGLSKQEMMSLCLKNNVTLYDFNIYQTAESLHGKVSELLFREEFEKNEDSQRYEQIANALSYHVAGEARKPNILDKIIYVADNIEPEKDAELFQRVKNGEVNSINECIKMVIEKKKEKAKLQGRESNPMMYATLEYIEKEDDENIR